MARRSDDEGYKTFSRRTVLIGGLQILGLGILGGRLGYLQIIEGNRYKVLADKNRINLRLISPPRGLIVDRFGVPLAVNVENFQVHMIREQTEDMRASLLALQKLIALENQVIDSVIEQAKKVPKFLPVKVKEDLTWEEVARIQVNLPDLPGLFVERGETRNYPYGLETSHLTGYVGAVSEEVLKAEGDKEPVLSLPGFKIGKIGIERQYDNNMRGKAGASEIEVNVVGREVRELKRIDATPGDRITLTIDAELQRYAHELLTKERSASAVVMDANTGAVYVMASHPGYDPNLFSGGIPANIWKSLLEDTSLPLSHKALVGQYPPGSTFKMVTALAALEAGVISVDEQVYCPGFTQLGDRKFHCWRRGGHGHVNLTQSLERSCDVYYYEVAQRVGIDKIADMARRLGIGVRHDLPMSAVSEGNAPTKDWKQTRYGKDWLVGDTLNSAIGQGYVLASPLQLAVMAARVASGKAVEPQLIRAIDDVPVQRQAPPPLDVNPAYLAAVRGGMYAVMNGKHGTASASRTVSDAVLMAGKTGTSQVRNISAAERAAGVVSNDDLPWERRDHALFVCFAPYDAPKVAVSVIVEHGGGGSTVAAPIARDILLYALYDGLPPVEVYPEGQRSRIREEQDALPLAAPESFEAGRSRA